MAFNKLKAFLTHPLVLASPEPEQPLLLYIAVTNQVVSTALVRERKESGHIHAVQRSVSDYETRYPHVQKLLYVILITKHKLLHYFASH